MDIMDFINEFNDYYPFERYIVKTPKSFVYLFDDAQLTEVFVPSTEIKPIVIDGQFVGHTKAPTDEIYIKIKGPAGEMRFALYDFADAVISDILSQKPEIIELNNNTQKKIILGEIDNGEI